MRYEKIRNAECLINPKMLKWVRIRAGIPLKRMAELIDSYRDIEKGNKKMVFYQFDKFQRFCKYYCTAAFYLPKPPNIFDVIEIRLRKWLVKILNKLLGV